MSDLPAATGSQAEVSAALPWQSGAWARLVQQLEIGQLPHALLLSGPRYSGKERFAQALARLLLCHAPESGSNCGRCHACQLTRSGNHGDFRWLTTEGTSRVIKVDQVREVVNFVTGTANLGQRKIVIISPAEAMHRSAANALLKSLEEPSPDTYLLLVCHRAQALPATIRSRCQVQLLVPPQGDEALLWLDQLTGSREESRQALELADGQVMLAERLALQADLAGARGLHEAVEAIVAGRGDINDIERYMGDNTLAEVLALIQRSIYRRMRQTEAPRLTAPAARGAFALLDELVRLQRVVASGANPNRQLLLDSLGAQLSLINSAEGEAGGG